MIRKQKVFIILFTSFTFSLWLGIRPVMAQSASMSFVLADPGTTVNVGDTFQVNILINTQGIDTINGDALFTFEPANIRVDSAASGNFFTYFASSSLDGYNDKYLVSSWEESVAHAKKTSSDTLFATLTLSALKEGTTSLSFDCTTGSEADTNVNRASDSQDIISCPLTPLSILIGAETTSPTPGLGTTVAPTQPGSSLPTSTPKPTATRTPTPTRKPTATKAPVPTKSGNGGGSITELPRAGVFGPTIFLAGLGTLLTVVGVLIIL